MKLIHTLIAAITILMICGTASAWLSGYDNRMAITVNNTGTSTINYYQFNFTNDTNTLVAAGHMQASGADCRITDASDNLIPFWNENAFNATNTKIWGNATTLSVGDNTFYMYYGNPAAESVSSGADTFEFFDDFETPQEFLERYAGNPVVTHSGSGWDGSSVREPDCIYHDSKYWLYFHGAEAEANIYPRRIGLATSTDGYNFTKESTYVLEGGTDESVGVPAVIYHDNKTWLYYTAGPKLDSSNRSIRLATSTDGVNFTKEPTNPILEKTGTGWESGVVQPIDVLYNDSNFWLFYRATNSTGTMRLGVATSTDGVNFTRHPSNPIFESDQSWEGGRVAGMRVFYYDSKWRMYYSGNYGYNSACGYAESDDLTNWTKYEYNPVFECDSSIAWEEDYSFWLTFVFKEDNSSLPGLLYYVGKSESTTHNQIGVANQTAVGMFYANETAWHTLDGNPDYYNTIQAKSPTHSLQHSNPSAEGSNFSQTASDSIAFDNWVYVDSVTTRVYLLDHGNGMDNIMLLSIGQDISYYSGGAWHDTGVNIVLDAWKKLSVYDINWTDSTFKMNYDGNTANCNIRQGDPANIDSIALRVINAVTYRDDIRVRKFSSPEPTSSLGAEEAATITEPVITLLSQTPSTLYQNSTGYMNISYGITHDSSGLNNTSVSFIFRNYDHTLNDANHSIRPPANDKCEVWNFDGQIMRAANRNETLNFENNDSITGGDTFTWSGLDENNTRLTIVPVNSTYTIVHINGTIHDLAMEQMWYLDRTDMVESPKTQLSIHKSQDVLIKFWNAEIFKGNYDFIGIGYTDTSLNSAPASQPSDATPVSFYYLNSSYDPLSGVDPLASGYAVLMGSLNATQWVDHVYSPDQNASYVRGAINNTLLNSVIDTTEISYLYFKSETPSSKPYYINITDSSTNTNRTFGQTNVLWIGDTAPYTAHPYTPNVWFAFVYDSTSFDHKLYVADNNDKWGNSTLQSTNIGAGLFPPTIPTIHHFNFNGSTDYDKNKTYSGIIDVGIGVSTDPDGGTVTHNLTLHYANKTFVAIINNTFTDAGIIGNGVYSNISFNTTPYYSETEEYTLKVSATDDEGETSESWSCCNFTLGTHQISNIHTTTLVYDRIVWGWTNPDHYDTIMVYLDNIWKQNTTSASYSASGLNQATAYTIKLITVYAGEESDPVTDTQVTTTEQGGSGGGGGTPAPTPTPTATPIITPLPDENVTENVSIAIEPIPDITEEIVSNYTVTGSIWHLSFDKHAVFVPEHPNIIACNAVPPYACRYYEDQKKFEIVIDGESPEPVFKADQWVTFITRDGKRISQRIDTKVYNPLFYFTMPAISGSVGDLSRYFVHGDEYMVDGVRFWWLGLIGAGLIAWRWRKR